MRPAPPVFDLIAAYGIGMIAVVVAAAWIAITARREARATRWASAGTLAVMALSAAAATSGALARFDVFPPPMLLMIASVAAMSFGIGLSPFGGAAAAKVSFAALIGLQGFRLPLELVMHRAATVGIMPNELSYSGYNFDIVTGASALVLFALLRGGAHVPRAVLWAWNVWGSFCLVVIVVVALATSPMVRAFGDDPRHLNTWVVFFPYVWLPVVLVTIAMSGHVIVTRKLLLQPDGSASQLTS